MIYFCKRGGHNALIGGYSTSGMKGQVGIPYLELRSVDVLETFVNWRDAAPKKRNMTRRHMKSRIRGSEAKNRRVGESKKWGC